MEADELFKKIHNSEDSTEEEELEEAANTNKDEKEREKFEILIEKLSRIKDEKIKKIALIKGMKYSVFNQRRNAHMETQRENHNAENREIFKRQANEIKEHEAILHKHHAEYTKLFKQGSIEIENLKKHLEIHYTQDKEILKQRSKVIEDIQFEIEKHYSEGSEIFKQHIKEIESEKARLDQYPGNKQHSYIKKTSDSSSNLEPVIRQTKDTTKCKEVGNFTEIEPDKILAEKPMEEIEEVQETREAEYSETELDMQYRNEIDYIGIVPSTRYTNNKEAFKKRIKRVLIKRKNPPSGKDSFEPK